MSEDTVENASTHRDCKRKRRREVEEHNEEDDDDADELDEQQKQYEERSVRRVVERSPPPQYPYPTSEASSSLARSPPPFSSIFVSSSTAPLEDFGSKRIAASEGELAGAAPAYTTSSQDERPFEPSLDATSSRALSDPVQEIKSALPPDTKGDASSRKDDEAEPPPAYTEEENPLPSFSYLMAAASGPSSLITQVQQGGPSVNALGDFGADESIAMDLR